MRATGCAIRLSACCAIVAALRQEFQEGFFPGIPGQLFELFSTQQSNTSDISCSDPEPAEWLNRFVRGLWAYIDAAALGLVKKHVEPLILDAIPDEVDLTVMKLEVEKLLNFSFTELSLGEQPMRISDLQMCNGPEGDLRMKLRIAYKSTVDFKVSTSVATFGLHDFSIHGALVISFGQFINRIPFVGGITAYFIDPPRIDWELSGIGDVVEVNSWVEKKIRKMIDTAVAWKLVLPNRIIVPFAQLLGVNASVDMAALTNPKPLGLLQVVPKRVNLSRQSDFDWIGRNTEPDPYVVFKVGSQKWTSTWKEKTLTAEWAILEQEDPSRQSALFTILDREQSLQAYVMDHDMVTGDDEIGADSLSVQDSVSPTQRNERDEVSFNLKNRRSGASEGTLDLDTRFLCLANVSQRLTLLPRVLRVHIRKVEMPEGNGDQVKVVAKVNKEESTTPYLKDNDLNSILYVPVPRIEQQILSLNVLSMSAGVFGGGEVASFNIGLADVPEATTLENAFDDTQWTYEEGSDKQVTLFASVDLIGTRECDDPL